MSSIIKQRLSLDYVLLPNFADQDGFHYYLISKGGEIMSLKHGLLLNVIFDGVRREAVR